MTRSFYTIHAAWVSRQEWSHPVTIPMPEHTGEGTETAEETVSSGSDDSVIVINGKTFTKAELKKLLE